MLTRKRSSVLAFGDIREESRRVRGHGLELNKHPLCRGSYAYHCFKFIKFKTPTGPDIDEQTVGCIWIDCRKREHRDRCRRANAIRCIWKRASMIQMAGHRLI